MQMRKTLFILAWLLSFPAFSHSADWNDWPVVGQGRLVWGFWVIYDSQLRTPSGRYDSESDELALIITYRRNITKDALLEATDDQWRHLGLPKVQRQGWLKQLSAIWPDIKENDHLVFVLSEQGGVFYQEGKTVRRFD